MAHPLRVCAQAGCPTLVPRGRCAEHDKGSWHSEQPRIRGRRLQTLRAALFASEPLCRTCLIDGRTTPATIRDHVIPLAEGGTDTEDNVQPLCQDCSDIKTQAESMRGARH